MIGEQWEQGHFYSVLPRITEDAKIDADKEVFTNIDYNDASHLGIISTLEEELKDFKFNVPTINSETPRDEIINTCALYRDTNLSSNMFKYYQINNAFEWMDARMLFYFIKTKKPRTIIEIGSGWSTLLIHNTVEQFNLETKIICIEPYPLPWLVAMNKMGIIELNVSKLEDMDLGVFSQLGADDICFIDSSHVVKYNSDCLFYINRILPILNEGVLIHIHDIFLPYEYPESWYKEGRFWNEQYFVYAFLMNNDKFKIEFGNAYATKFPQLLHALRNSYEYKVIKGIDKNKAFGGGSLWLSKSS